MAHKKGQGSTKNGRDSNPQYRGVKLYGGQRATAGAIIIRQCEIGCIDALHVAIKVTHTMCASASLTSLFSKFFFKRLQKYIKDI
mgnify:CR=1 FL=1